MKERRKARPRSAPRAPGDRWAPVRRALPFAAVALFLVAGAYRFDPKPSVSGDNAQFLILGESLATGRGLSHINEPDPSPNTKYPFLFPMILAGVHMVAPGSVPAAKVVVFLFGALSVFLLSRIFLRLGPLPVAVAASLLTGIHPVLLEFSHQVLSEVPYLLVSALGLTFFLDWEDRRKGTLLAGAALASLGAYFTRSIGVSLVGALLLVLLYRRRIREALLIGGVCLVAAGGWGARNQIVGEGESYARQFLMKNPYRAEEGALTFRHFVVDRVGGNIAKYGRFEAGRGLFPAPFGGLLPSEVGWRAWISGAVCLIALAGLAVSLVRGIGVVELYTLLYVLLCLAWPEVWTSIRFLLPVLPLLLFYMLRAVAAAIRPLPKRAHAPAAAILLLFLVAGSVKANIDEKRFFQGDYPPVWRNYFEVADWARENTPEGTVFICRKPYLFYLRSRRLTRPYLWSNEKEEVWDQMMRDRADYVVLAPLSATTTRYLIPMVNAYPERFETVLHLENPDTWLLRVLPEAER